VTAGNASKLSDGSSASASARTKTSRNRRHGAASDDMWAWPSPRNRSPTQNGVLDPIFAIPTLLKRFGRRRDRQRIVGVERRHSQFRLSTASRNWESPSSCSTTSTGGAISIGHPYGMSGARMVGHALIRGEAAGCQICRRQHVYWWRPRGGRSVRNRLTRQAAVWQTVRALAVIGNVAAIFAKARRQSSGTAARGSIDASGQVLVGLEDLERVACTDWMADIRLPHADIATVFAV